MRICCSPDLWLEKHSRLFHRAHSDLKQGCSAQDFSSYQSNFSFGTSKIHESGFLLKKNARPMMWWEGWSRKKEGGFFQKFILSWIFLTGLPKLMTESLLINISTLLFLSSRLSRGVLSWPALNPRVWHGICHQCTYNRQWGPRKSCGLRIRDL